MEKGCNLQKFFFFSFYNEMISLLTWLAACEYKKLVQKEKRALMVFKIINERDFRKYMLSYSAFRRYISFTYRQKGYNSFFHDLDVKYFISIKNDKFLHYEIQNVL